MIKTVSTKSLLLGWMSISIWYDQNVLPYSSFLPWHQCAEKSHSIKRFRKELKNKWFVGLLRVHPLWMVCPAHVIFMMTGKWDTSYHPMQSHPKRFQILTLAPFFCWPCWGLLNVSHFLGVSQLSLKTKTTPKYCRHGTLQRAPALPRLYCVSRSPLHCGRRWRNPSSFSSLVLLRRDVMLIRCCG